MTQDSIPQDTPPETMYSKRYWLFRWYYHQAAGGLNDFVGSYDTIESAMAETVDNYMDRGHILDSKTQRLAAWVNPDGSWHTINA